MLIVGGNDGFLAEIALATVESMVIAKHQAIEPTMLKTETWRDADFLIEALFFCCYGETFFADQTGIHGLEQVLK